MWSIFLIGEAVKCLSGIWTELQGMVPPSPPSSLWMLIPSFYSVRLCGRRSPNVDKSLRSHRGSQSWQASFLCWVSFEGENESLNTLSNKNDSFHYRLARVNWSSMASPGTTMFGWYLQRQHFHAWQSFFNPSLVLLYLIEQLTLPWMWLVSLMVMMRMIYCGGADLDTLSCV